MTSIWRDTDVTSGPPYCIYLKHVSRKSIRVPQHTVGSHSLALQYIMPITYISQNCFEWNNSKDVVGKGSNGERMFETAADMNPTIDRKTEMEENHTVEKLTAKIWNTLGRWSLSVSQIGELLRRIIDDVQRVSKHVKWMLTLNQGCRTLNQLNSVTHPSYLQYILLSEPKGQKNWTMRNGKNTTATDERSCVGRMSSANRI